jgi:hypothetical protein
MIHGAFVTVELGVTDKLVRVGAQLLQIFAKFSEVSTLNYRAWLDEIVKQARRAQAEGDLRAGIDAQSAGEFIVSAMLGTELISNAVSGGADLVMRVTRMWELLLPAVAAEQSLPYLLEFLGRESLRRGGQPQLAT